MRSLHGGQSMLCRVDLPAMSPPGIRSTVTVEHDNGFVRILVQHVRRDAIAGGELVDGVQAVLAPIVALHMAKALLAAAEAASNTEAS